MNLILLDHDDFITGDRVRITGRRLEHVRSVHRAAPGDELTVGMIGGRIGTGTIIRLGDASLDMTLSLDRDPPVPLPLTVILSLPRPKVMRRVLYSLTVLGVKRIILIHSARVEKSYWQTPFLQKDAIRTQLLHGLEQSCDTVLPEVLQRTRFKPFLEDELAALVEGSVLLVAHPSAGSPCPRTVVGPVTLAIGPEGGFVPYEVDLFRKSGFQPVSFGSRILNVETAVPSLIAKIF
jgi:RsmE family RNA methyltransferase